MFPTAVKRRISDVLAWTGFVAIVGCLLSFVMPLLDVSGVITQLLDTYDEVSNCGSQRCEANVSIEGLPERQGWLGAVQSRLAEWRYEAFLIWLGIGFFQSFFIRSFRLLPWRPVIVRVVTRVPLEDLD
ncbi:MAG: hypothetical protein P8H30_06885 [Luminiphilus sp.]|jgi:hypothetical protein|nr:hypothetical protein [Luminiphilus sp.]MDG1771671.1 hypothetical protein [Luminiphilus sp.]